MPDAAEHLRVRPRAIVLAVLTIAATLLALRVLASAGRVIGWLAMASATAALISPVVRWLSQRMPRGVAVALTVLTGAALTGGIAYGIVGDVVAQTQSLQEDAPRLAAELEERGRFAEVAREARLAERVKRIVDDVPERLRGGSPAEAVRSATTRGLAFLAVTVLTIFLVLHGRRLADGALRQFHDDERRDLARRLGAAIEARAFGYARGTIGIAAMAGGFAFVAARAAGVPGPAPLALWVALWDVVPLFGFVVGALPVVVLGAVLSPTKGLVLAVAFLAWQVIEQVVLQRPLERRTVKVGPFLTSAAGFAGIELYGIAGGLLAIVAAAVAVVAVDTLAPAGDRVAQGDGDE